jgi:hypothetical protein
LIEQDAGRVPGNRLSVRDAFQAFAIKDLNLPAAGMNEPGRLKARRER